jgi:DNA-binding transcriptional LysR family regulator
MRDLDDLLYFACCPTHCAAKRCAQTLVPVLPGWVPRPGIFHAVLPSRHGLIPAVRRFLDFLGEASS